jgi:prepilin-type N-terminal cleavage/methylation domain-containing protein
MKRHTLKAFTLVEILIVLAILAILASLTLSVSAAAKQTANEAKCIAQLSQIGEAFHRFVDTKHRRPDSLCELVTSGFLNDKQLLVCPADPTGNLAGLYFQNMYPQATPYPFPVSYYYAGAMNPTATKSAKDKEWKLLKQQMGSAMGIVACQVHGTPSGLGFNDPKKDTILYYEGKILRLQFDGAIVKRRIQWYRTYYPNSTQVRDTLTSTWYFFSDKAVRPGFPVMVQ